MNNAHDTNDIKLDVSITIGKSNIASTNCGSHAPETIKKLMQDLANTPIPLTSCIFNIRARYTKEYSAKMYVSSDAGSYQPFQYHNASFCIVHRTCRKCARNKCTENIATGKCRDEYVQKNLGATLFPQHYAKDKQK